MGCPHEYCEPIASAVNMAELFKKGLPPVAGGVLDQAVWFIEAARFLEHEATTIEQEDAQR